MNRDHAMNLYPEGTDRLTVLDGELVMVNVVEHRERVMVADVKDGGVRLRLPYATLQWTVDR